MVAAVCAANYHYQASRFPFRLKFICSALFAALAVINLIFTLTFGSRSKAFALCMAAGTALAFCGDVLIMRDFILGAATFAAGHLCFLSAYFSLQKPHLSDFSVSGAVFLIAAAVLQFCPILYLGDSTTRFACFAYALIISFMLGKAVCNFCRNMSALTAVLAFGSALFFLSDVMLLFYCFSLGCRWANSACAAAYYPAMCLMSVSLCINLPANTPNRNT